MVYIWSLLLDIFTKKNYQCYYLSCFSYYSSFHYFLYCYCDSCLHYWCINIILSLSLQMVLYQQSRREVLLKHCIFRHAHPKAIDAWIQQANPLIHFCNPWFDMLIPSQILINDNTEILYWIFTLKIFWSMTGLIPWRVCNLLSPPNNTNFEFDVVTLPQCQING